MTQVFSHARITTITTIRRTRKLPRRSVPKVAMSQSVQANEVVAAVEIPEQHRMIKASDRLRVAPQELEKFMKKQVGDIVERGEVLAARGGFFDMLGGRRVVSPVDGKIVLVTDGKIMLEGGRKHVAIISSVPGKVVGISVGEQMVIETIGTLIQVAWGHGELTWGTLKTMDTKPGVTTDLGRFNVDHRAAIVAIGSPLTEDFLKGAVEIKVKGIIAASMHASLMPLVTRLDFPVALTQGFGHLPMSERILSLLNTYNGREITLDMKVAADWRESRPEIIIPLDSLESPKGREGPQEVAVGGRVRILQAPYLGEIGTITEIPDRPHRMENGLWLPGVLVDTPAKETIYLPFANLEYLG